MGLTRSGALYYVTTTGAGQRSSIQVASFDFATGKLLSGPTDLTQEYLESDTQPTWSHDGKYLAYFSKLVRSGPANSLVAIRSAETGQMIRELRLQLTNIYSEIQWAHDGRSLLLQGRDFKGRWGTFQIDAQTGDLSPIMFHPPADVVYPNWSPDGRSLYFRRQIPGNQGFALIQRGLASGNEKEVIRRALVAGPIISPDGKYIATSSIDPSTNSRVKLLLPADGGEPREMMRVSADVEAGALADYGKGIGFVGGHWAADSQSFVTRKVFNDPKRSDEFWRIPIDGSAPSKLDLSWLTTRGHVGTWQETIFRFHPDGQRIAYTVIEKGAPLKQEVWMLENFLPTVAAKK